MAFIPPHVIDWKWLLVWTVALIGSLFSSSSSLSASFSIVLPSVHLQMAIIFSEEDLNDVKPPCVIQSFINHNAVLYKVFVVGDSYTVVERPSLKNFPSGPAGEDTDG